ERGEAAVDERVQRVAPERSLREDVHVVVPGERIRPELRRERLVARHQRRQDDEDERQQEDQRGRDQQTVIRDRDQQALAPYGDRRPAADEAAGALERGGAAGHRPGAWEWEEGRGGGGVRKVRAEA